MGIWKLWPGVEPGSWEMPVPLLIDHSSSPAFPRLFDVRDKLDIVSKRNGGLYSNTVIWSHIIKYLLSIRTPIAFVAAHRVMRSTGMKIGKVIYVILASYRKTGGLYILFKQYSFLNHQSQQICQRVGSWFWSAWLWWVTLTCATREAHNFVVFFF